MNQATSNYYMLYATKGTLKHYIYAVKPQNYAVEIKKEIFFKFV